MTVPGLVIADQESFPARVLAECEAKRRIVELYDPEPADQGWLAATERTLRLLAYPYADHPDYRPEWRL